MSRKLVPFGGLIAALIALAGSAFAQVAPAPPDPLARIRAAAAANTEVCTNSEASACAQANPKILAAAMGSTVLAQNLQILAAAGDRESAPPKAVTAFRAAGVDLVSAEGGYTDPPLARGETTVIAEIRGREKPDEFVVVAANLEDACNVAMVVEAARDIHLTGLRPRRTIRFAIFSGKSIASWAYVRRHRGELDRAIAAVTFENGCARVTGFTAAGREDLETGVREALNFDPIKAWGTGDDTYRASSYGDDLDFLLEGVPALTANRQAAAAASKAPASPTEVDLDTLKKNAAIAGVLAFGLAEHATPLGPRLVRADIERLLTTTGLREQMMRPIIVDKPTDSSDGKIPQTPQVNLWELWQKGQVGRVP